MPKPHSNVVALKTFSWRFHCSLLPCRKRRPWVSVVIDDMGVDTWASERAVQLRPAVTLSYLPYGPQVREQVGKLAAAADTEWLSLLLL